MPRIWKNHVKNLDHKTQIKEPAVNFSLVTPRDYSSNNLLKNKQLMQREVTKDKLRHTLEQRRAASSERSCVNSVIADVTINLIDRYRLLLKQANIKQIEALEASFTSDVFAMEDSKGVMIAHLAAMYNRLNVLALALRERLVCHAADRNGDTVMHYAARGNHQALIEYLSDQGVDITTANKNGQTCIDILFLDNQKVRDNLLLLMPPAWINHTMVHTKPLLHYLFAVRSYDSAFKLLAKKHVHAQIEDSNGYNLLHAIVAKPLMQAEVHEDMLSRLLHLGVALNHHDHCNETPTELAVRLHHAPSIRALLGAIRFTGKDRDLLAALFLHSELRPVVVAYDTQKKQNKLACKMQPDCVEDDSPKRASKFGISLPEVCDMILHTRRFVRYSRM